MKGNGLPSFLVRAFLVLGMLFLISCASAHKSIVIPQDFEIGPEKEMQDKIPLRALLNLSSEFKRFILSTNLSTPAQTKNEKFIFGDALSAGSRKMTANIFREVAPFESGEDTFTENDVIVTPEIVKIEHWRTTGPGGYCAFQTVIKWSITSADGKDIFSETIRGDEIRFPCVIGLAFTYDKKRKEGFALSLQDHFQKAQESIYSSGWWKKQWWK
jgi:hypothetical protein